MEVLHAHCAGLDLHKDSVVGCVRHMEDGKVRTTFRTTTQELMTLSDWLSGGRGHAYRHGSDGRLLEAGLAYSVRWQVRIGFGDKRRDSSRDI